MYDIKLQCRKVINLGCYNNKYTYDTGEGKVFINLKKLWSQKIKILRISPKG